MCHLACPQGWETVAAGGGRGKTRRRILSGVIYLVSVASTVMVAQKNPLIRSTTRYPIDMPFTHSRGDGGSRRSLTIHTLPVAVSSGKEYD